MRSKRSIWLPATLAATALLATACSDDETDAGGDTETTDGGTGETTDGATEEEPATSGGSVFVSGSSTVEPISAIVADELTAQGSSVQVDVEGPGTGDGFELFCNGESDISDASRPISAEEVAACEASGIEFVELEVAFDGISVLTSPANEIECLSFADLYALVGPESEGFANWSDGQEIAAALGSTTTLPDVPLDITAPGTESGTYDAFAELALADPSEAQVEAGAITEDQAETIRPDYASQSDDNAIIAGIESSDSSFGWVGFAFAEGAGDAVREIPISAEGGGDCVEPSIETIADGTYPLSRSLYIYVSMAAMDENPAVAEYVDFYMTDDSLTGLVEEAGYVPLPDDRLAAAQETWESMTTGTTAGG